MTYLCRFNRNLAPCTVNLAPRSVNLAPAP